MKNMGVKGFIPTEAKTETRFERGRTGLVGNEASWARLPPGATNLESVPCRNPEIT